MKKKNSFTIIDQMLEDRSSPLKGWFNVTDGIRFAVVKTLRGAKANAKRHGIKVIKRFT